MKAELINFLVNFIVILEKLIFYAIIGRILMSWMSMGRGRMRGGFADLIYGATDPILNLAKKLPHVIWMIDLSPIIAIFGVEILANVLIKLLMALV